LKCVILKPPCVCKKPCPHSYGSGATKGFLIGAAAGAVLGIMWVAAMLSAPETGGASLMLAAAGEPLLTPLIVGGPFGAGYGATIGVAAGAYSDAHESKKCDCK